MAAAAAGRRSSSCTGGNLSAVVKQDQEASGAGPCLHQTPGHSRCLGQGVFCSCPHTTEREGLGREEKKATQHYPLCSGCARDPGAFKVILASSQPWGSW